MNTKPFFWESEANLETLQKLFLILGLLRYILKSVKSLNRVLCSMEYWLNTL